MNRRKREKAERRSEHGRVRKDGSRVSWLDYIPGQSIEMKHGEMLVMNDGCTAERRGERVRWIEPAALLAELQDQREADRAA